MTDFSKRSFSLLPSPRRGQALKRFRQTAAGNALVEFALVAPVLILFLFGIIEFGRAYWCQSTLNYAVEEAARFGIVNPDVAPSELESIVLEKAGGLVPAPTVTVTIVANTSIKIEAAYNFNYIAFPYSSSTLTASSQYPIP